MSAARVLWVPWKACADAWGGPTGNAKEDNARRSRRSAALKKLIAEGRAERRDGAWHIAGDFVLPNGQRADVFVQAARQFRPPSGWRKLSESQQRRWRALAERQRLFGGFARDNPTLKGDERYARFGSVHAAELKALGLTADAKSIRIGLDVLRGKRELQRRGRPVGSGRLEWNPRAIEIFEGLYYTERKPFLADVLQTVRAFAHTEGFEAPTLAMARRLVKEKPHAIDVLRRKGAKAYDALCVPKGQRWRQTVRGWWSLDCRTEDAFAQAPDGKGGLRHVRLTCAGIFIPFARKWADLRFGPTENYDLIAAGVRAAALGEDGLPAVVQTDNGSSYDALTGAPRGTERQRADFDRGGVGGFFRQFDVSVIKSEPYKGYQKQIEGAWNDLKNELDRYVRSFCGGRPSERPEKAETWARAHVAELPTLAQFNEWAALVKETLNATPRPALGGLTPNIYMERYGPARRRVSADAVDIYLAPLLPEARKCGRDGVRLDNFLYVPEPEELVKLQGKTVRVRRDPELADRIILCDKNGAALCHAYCERISGATRIHAREHAQRVARYKAKVREYAPARDFLLRTSTSQILQVKRDFAKAEEARMRAESGSATERDAKLVRADLAESAAKVKGKERARVQRQARHKAVGAEGVQQAAWDLLAYGAEHTERAESAGERQERLLAELSDGGSVGAERHTPAADEPCQADRLLWLVRAGKTPGDLEGERQLSGLQMLVKKAQAEELAEAARAPEHDRAATFARLNRQYEDDDGRGATA